MNTRQIGGLTSLRFFAAFAILLHHSQGIFVPEGYFNNIPFFGGVGFFFVLSGFILSHAHSSLSGARDITRFYISRVARLWPAHVVCTILILFLIPYQASLLHSWNNIVIFFSNLFLVHSVIPVPIAYFSFNSVSWSISTEMFFYAAFPALLVLLPSSPVAKYVAIVALGAALAAALDYSGVPFFPSDNPQGVTGHGLIYISPIGRIQEFVLGILCHRFMAGIDRMSINFKFASTIEVMAVVAVILLSPVFAFWLRPYIGKTSPALFEFVRHTLLALLFAAMICFFYLDRGIVSKALSWRPLVLLGEISFSLYLIHQIFFRAASENHLLTGFSPFIRFSLVASASIMVAYLIWRYVEKPCQKWVMRTYDIATPRSRQVEPTD